MNTLEEACIEKGFSGVDELNEMVASVNISTVERRILFEAWHRYDGTKAGLQEIIDLCNEGKGKA